MFHGSVFRIGDEDLRANSDGDDFIYKLASSFEVGTTNLSFPTKINMFGNVSISAGLGTPEGAVTASQGSLFLRNDGGAGTSMYVKESGSGNTGWVAK